MHLTFAKRVCECPVCESSSVRRSARKGFVERTWFRMVFVWPYRCDDCDSRFWGFHRSYQAMAARLSEVPLSLYGHPVLASSRVEVRTEVFRGEAESLAHS